MLGTEGLPCALCVLQFLLSPLRWQGPELSACGSASAHVQPGGNKRDQCLRTCCSSGLKTLCTIRGSEHPCFVLDFIRKVINAGVHNPFLLPWTSSLN